MCGRYALSLRPSEVRAQLESLGMPADEAPDDDDVRQSYNVAPGYYELVYRADVPDWGAGPRRHHEDEQSEETNNGQDAEGDDPASGKEARFKLQAMKWGLIPFWTKRNPDYGSMLKTINCRDDSLAAGGGMWNTMKQRKRCVVICQGFYEWLKKDGGKTRIPYYTRRKDGQLMCFAGLWDVCKYENEDEKHYTYTIITTDANEHIKFLHNRMPVILDNGSEEMRTWLDSSRSTWSKELQNVLKPYKGELETYPVSKDVNKVGNNSPTFIIPIDSKDNKNNIANLFANAKSSTKGKGGKEEIIKEEEHMEEDSKIKHEEGEERKTTNEDTTEDNAPLPSTSPPPTQEAGMKRKHDSDEQAGHRSKSRKSNNTLDSQVKLEETSPPRKNIPSSGGKTRSALKNGTAIKSSPKKKTAGDGSQRITNFFNK